MHTGPLIVTITNGLLKGKDDSVSCFGKVVYPVPDPLKAWKSLLRDRRIDR